MLYYKLSLEGNEERIIINMNQSTEEPINSDNSGDISTSENNANNNNNSSNCSNNNVDSSNKNVNIKPSDKNESVASSEILSKNNVINNESQTVRHKKRLIFDKSDLVKISLFILLLIIFAVIIVHYFPFFMSLRDHNARMLWISDLRSMGVRGFFAIIGIQITQIVIAIIPGEPVEIAAGYLYGTWGGLAACLLGVFFGSCIILVIVRLLGVSFVKKLIKEESINKLKFLHNTKSLETVVFILFLIPGTPKDMLTYFIPLTSMKSLRFLIISTFARIPSVVTSTIVGASLGQSKWGLSIFVFALTAAMGIIGIQINNWYMKKHHNNHHNHTNIDTNTNDNN